MTALLENKENETPAQVAQVDSSSFSVTTRSERDTMENKTTVRVEIDNLDVGRRVEVKAHPVGLVVEVIPKYRYYYRPNEDRRIIPGQYGNIDDVVKFIADRGELMQIKDGANYKNALQQIKYQLLSSQIWQKRGKLRWKNVPEEFWEVVSIDDFAIGTIKSYYQWWMSALLKKGNANKRGSRWYVKDDVHKDITNGIFPEKMNSIRYWKNMSFDELMAFVGCGYSTKKQWGTFVMQVRETFYESVMRKHNDWSDPENFETVVEYLGRCPKNAAFAEGLNNLINSGLTVPEVVGLGITHPKDLRRATELSKQFNSIYRERKAHLNPNYKPPAIKLEEGYEWATNDTFFGLSDKYACCISRYGSYEDWMVQGVAHVLFREDHATNRGVLAYIKYEEPYESTSWRRRNRNYNADQLELDAEGTEDDKKPKGKWEVYEIRGYGNCDPYSEYNDYAHAIAKELNKKFPGPSKPVEQMERDDLIAAIAGDELGQKIKSYYDARPYRNGYY